MCGIVAAIAQRNVIPILIEGLKRLEYRGYDSAGVALLDAKQSIRRYRRVGKVAVLEQSLPKNLSGFIGIAHTRWATHGKPSEQNAHPHMSGRDVALVHNGIIENYTALRQALVTAGYTFESETDTEIIAHLLDQQLKQGQDFLAAVFATIAQLHGAFALVFLYRCQGETPRLIAVRRGSPLVIGLGLGENFVASDHLALLPVTQQFIYLNEGEVAEIFTDAVHFYNAQRQRIERSAHYSTLASELISKGGYRHFMQKEIFEQSEAIHSSLEGRILDDQVIDTLCGFQASERLHLIRHVHIVACGTSYHAGLVARHWLESEVGIPCRVDIASEFRYQTLLVEPDTLFVTLSQSGETADTLEALRQAKLKGYAATLAICNVPESTLVRESDYVLLTRAGPEISVASTKAFTTQLTALLLLTAFLGRQQGWTAQNQRQWARELRTLPSWLEMVLALDKQVKLIAKRFAEKTNALFIARGIHYPIALEGALKLKEISYIHAEAYPAGELKHGPLALIDKTMPVIVLVPANALLSKLLSNIEEVRARGGELIIFTEEDNLAIKPDENITLLNLPKTSDQLSPILFTIPLQLLAYHVAVLKGTDVDQPRNLAKSVTVE